MTVATGHSSIVSHPVPVMKETKAKWVSCAWCGRTFDGNRGWFFGPIRRIVRIPQFGPPRKQHIFPERDRFCSRKCLERWEAGWRYPCCSNCLHYFSSRRFRNLPAKLRRKLFCSPGCKAVYRLRAEKFDPNWWDFLRGSDWQWFARNVKQRDSYTCQVCGCKESVKTKLTVDHIVPLRLSMDHNFSNLMAVCQK